MNSPVVSTSGVITADTPEAKAQPNRYEVTGKCLATIKAGSDEALTRSSREFTAMLDDPEKLLTADAHAMAVAIRDAINAELDSRVAR